MALENINFLIDDLYGQSLESEKVYNKKTCLGFLQKILQHFTQPVWVEINGNPTQAFLKYDRINKKIMVIIE